MKLTLVVIFLSGIAGAQQLPTCYLDNNVQFRSAVITDVSNLAKRMAELPSIGGQPNLLANIGTSTILPSSVASGELISVIGVHLTQDDLTAATDASWPTTLNGTQIFINDGPAPILYAGKRRDAVVDAVAGGEILAQIPYNLQSATITLQVVLGGTCGGNLVTIPVTSTASVLLRLNGDVAVQTADGNFTTKIKPGEEVAIYGVGLGEVVPVAEAGKPDSQLTTLLNIPTVRVGEAEAKVVYGGLSPGSVGLYQINFVVPFLPGGSYTVRVGEESFNLQIQ
jgi:uncharacterized protein (TIGR03437 family)